VVELVRVDVERDAGARVAELPGCASRVDAGADEVARERVTKVPFKTRGLLRLVVANAYHFLSRAREG
jgi:hypothetical protein